MGLHILNPFVMKACMEIFDPQAAIDAEKVYSRLNITSETIENTDDIGFE